MSVLGTYVVCWQSFVDGELASSILHVKRMASTSWSILGNVK
jgi:hypothetical protein